MVRLALLCSLVFSLLFTQVSRADDDNTKVLVQALALQQRVQELIERVESSIVCLHVSRSDAYQRYGHAYGQESPGKLGKYDADAADRYLRQLGMSQPKRREILARLDLSDPDNTPESYGSGVVLDASGLILTNYHVIQEATKIYVRLPQRQGSYADILAADPRSDLAVLKLLNPDLKLTAIKFGNGDTVHRGQFVLSLAHPFAAGFQDGQPSASWGIISNIRRRVGSPAQEEERHKTLYQHGSLIETDVRLRAGCSGGALINLEGEMIGMTTALAAVHGLEVPGGFAIPINDGMLRIVDMLRRGQEVEYGFLGVGFERTTDSAAGVALSYVTPGSPADRHGLRPKDLLLSINGRPVTHSDDLLLALGTLLAGSKVKLEVRKVDTRAHKTMEISLDKYYVPGKIIAANTQRPWFRGLRVDYTSLLVQQHPLGAGRKRIPPGVFICDVQPNSSAATALLKPGEIITHVNNRAVNTPAAFYEQVRLLSGPLELTLLRSEANQPAPKVILN